MRREGDKKRELHELPHNEMGKSELIGSPQKCYLCDSNEEGMYKLKKIHTGKQEFKHWYF